MPAHDDRSGEQHETALDEALHEIEDAETHTPDPADHHHDGEAAEATTPNTTAQEESRGE
ncbi:hypothetical protein ABZT03_25805 [Streptomyces sp. NPDC005574]|uniref:hypothetical protein n=1 Tax=Streptomyces sp. NPDC005574 TaxID=3156891 RepID=UPI00339FC9FE